MVLFSDLEVRPPSGLEVAEELEAVLEVLEDDVGDGFGLLGRDDGAWTKDTDIAAVIGRSDLDTVDGARLE